MLRLERYHNGRDISFELDEDFEQLKAGLQDSMVDYLRDKDIPQATKDLAECNTYADLSIWYETYEPIYFSIHNHEYEDIRHRNLADKMLSWRYVDFDDMGGRDYWKFSTGGGGVQYANFYTECDLLIAKNKFNLGDDDVDILRI